MPLQSSVLGKGCLRGSAFVVAVFYLAMSISFLYFSFIAESNETLKLMGEQINGFDSNAEETHSWITNYQLDKKAQVSCIMMSFMCIMVASFAVSSAYSQEHCINYTFGYCSVIMMVIFATIGCSYMILAGKFYQCCS